MKPHSRSTELSLLSIFLVLLFALTGCQKPQANLTAGAGTASFDAPDALLTALTITNDGSAPAEDVQVSSLSIAGATLTLPTSLPSSLGSIPPDGGTTLNANFTSPAAKPDTDYLLTVGGTFREQGHEFSFALDRKSTRLNSSHLGIS